MTTSTTRSASSSILLRLPPELHTRLSAHAAARMTPVSVLLRQIVLDHLDSVSTAPKPAQPTPTPAATPAPAPKPVAAPKPKPNPGPTLLGPKGFAPGTDLFRAAFYWHLDNLGLLSAAPRDIAAKYQIPEAIITATISYGLNNRGLRHIDVPEHTVDGITFPARQGLVPMTTRERLIVCREGGECMPEDPPEAFELREPDADASAHTPAPRSLDPEVAAKLDNLFE